MRDIGETDDENLFEPIRALAEELNRNNILVISTPMWNLTVPYVVKQYIDIVVQPGKLPYYGTNRKFALHSLPTRMDVFVHVDCNFSLLCPGSIFFAASSSTKE